MRNGVLAAALGTAIGLGAAADAATYRVSNDGGTLLGTFQADAGGGQVSAPGFSVAGVDFDAIDPADVPEYRVATNDLTGPGGTVFANLYNSAPAAGCAALGCVLFFESINPGPPDTFVYGGINLDTFENFAGGNYRIAPIPLPAGGVLLLGGLVALGAMRRLRTRG